MSDYKPTEHGGMKQDGTPDKRVGTGEFAHGKVDPHEAGKQGGQTTGGDSDNTTSNGSSNSSGGDYKPTENDGLKQDGTPDKRVKGN